MKILITGANGFLGSAITESWKDSHQIIKLDRSEGADIKLDLAKEIPQLPPVDLVIHAAGKAHSIPMNPDQEAEFFQINEGGTRNLLNGLNSLPKQMVLISTVAVYGEDEGRGIVESAPLKGTTPYAKSKILAEELWKKWAEENDVNFLILRLPLIAAPNPPGNLGAMIKAIKNGYYFRLGEGKARKSMVLASDLAKFIPRWMDKKGVFNLTDGVHPSVAELDEFLCRKLSKPVRSIPEAPIRFLAKIGDFIPILPVNSYRIQKLSFSLTFSDKKAQSELGWKPLPVIGNF
ncbi:MAG: NAD-dependent epimerase/dehydratase family protein [Flavobacteriaceae bacterium]|nr:NAD-dependent epimerase/dehydratase family protein [Flavobacteriaceae bacterium]